MMSYKLAVLLYISTLVTMSSCHTSTGRQRYGLIGYGINMYFPTCCTACRAVLSPSQLNCSETMSMDDMHGMTMTMTMTMTMDGAEFETSPSCYATDDAFLQSLALCIDQKCPQDPSVGDLKIWQIEYWWRQSAPGTTAIQPDPKESYAEALAKAYPTPSEVLVSGEPLTRTLLVSDEDYESNWNALVTFERMENVHERYALVVFLSGVVAPVSFSLLRFIPFPNRWVSFFNAWFVDPPAFGRRHKVPTLWGLTQVPTRGQAFFVSYLLTVNVVLSATGFSSVQPSAWFESTSGEILTYVTNRLGVLSFANVPLLILYAGRNNVLLWLTNWSHETFQILHRYVAGIATLQAIMHSLIYLQIYVASGEHSTESRTPFWYWGAIATIAMSVLLPTSILPIRRRLYEAFLMWHIVVSILAVAGCYLHIYYRFEHQWGYETWIYVAIAVWVFDRLLRVARLVRNGLTWAHVTTIDDDYIRVDIDGVSGSGHAYLYFPTLTWRVWENHPFSVASSVIDAPEKSPVVGCTGAVVSDVEKTGLSVSEVARPSRSSDGESEVAQAHPPKVALTFLLRTRGGLTSLLRRSSRIPVLVEAPYGQHPDLSAHPTLICVVGGVGITAVLPLLRAHPGRSILLWGVRRSALVDAMSASLTHVETKTFVGDRMVVQDELERQLNDPLVGDNPVIVVSGPDTMADDARNAVCRISRQKKGLAVRLVEESFSW